ncbi:MAG: hypothetical protein ACK5JD_06280 [Mangrovibacterium sp.]
MFKHALSMVLGFLRIDAFAKADGKSKLSEEQKKQLAEEFGEQFVAKFEADLAKYEATGDDPLRDRLAASLKNLESVVESQRQTLEKMQAENATLKDQVDKLADTPEPEPAAEHVTVDGKKKLKFNVNRNLAHNKIAADYLAGDHRVLAAGETIDVDSVIQEFGSLIDYVKLDMIRDIFQGFETAQYLTWKREIHSYKATRALITSVIQQFVPKFTPLGTPSFKPLEIPLRRFKINVNITPADVKDWIFSMYDEGKDLDQHPVTLYIVNQLIAPKAEEDLDDICANGEFEELDWSAVNEGDQGQDPIKSIDGFMTILKKDKALGDGARLMNYIQLAAEITADNVIDQVNLFVDSIDKKYKRREMPVFIDPTLYRMYKRAYKKLYGENSADPNFGGDIIDYSKNRLVPMYNMTDSGAMFTTPKENFIGLRHTNEPGATKLTLRKYDYDIHCLGEFRFGIGFAIAGAVFYSIPDIVSGGGAGV